MICIVLFSTSAYLNNTKNAKKFTKHFNPHLMLLNIQNSANEFAKVLNLKIFLYTPRAELLERSIIFAISRWLFPLFV